MMTQKFFYIVNHFVPFPSSEYGGIWNVVAENDDECFDLIAERDEGFNEIKKVVNLFQWLLPGLIINVAFMKEQIK